MIAVRIGGPFFFSDIQSIWNHAMRRNYIIRNKSSPGRYTRETTVKLGKITSKFGKNVLESFAFESEGVVGIDQIWGGCEVYSRMWSLFAEQRYWQVRSWDQPAAVGLLYTTVPCDVTQKFILESFQYFGIGVCYCFDCLFWFFFFLVEHRDPAKLASPSWEIYLSSWKYFSWAVKISMSFLLNLTTVF